MDILDETMKNLNETELEDTEKFGDAIELKCSECKTVTRFYYVDIQPYIDFYQEEYKYPETIKCPVCGAPGNEDVPYGQPQLYLDKLCFGCKSPDGRKFEIIKEGDKKDGE